MRHPYGISQVHLPPRVEVIIVCNGTGGVIHGIAIHSLTCYMVLPCAALCGRAEQGEILSWTKSTLQCLNKAVKFIKTPHYRQPIARLHERANYWVSTVSSRSGCSVVVIVMWYAMLWYMEPCCNTTTNITVPTCTACPMKYGQALVPFFALEFEVLRNWCELFTHIPQGDKWNNPVVYW